MEMEKEVRKELALLKEVCAAACDFAESSKVCELHKQGYHALTYFPLVGSPTLKNH